MNARQRKDNEISFEGLVAFDSVPPPKGAGPDEGRGDVHNACTAVAELPDDFLEALKNGVKADVSRLAKKSLAASTTISSDEPDEVTNLFERPEAPTSPYGAKILSPELYAPAPTPPPPAYAEPYVPAPSYAPPSHPPARLSIDTPPPMAIAGPPTVRPSFVERLWTVRQSVNRRSIAIGIAAVVGCGLGILFWALVLRRF